MPETRAKGLAQRIPLNYYKRPDAILKAKRVLAAIALVVAVGWWASGLEFRDGQVGSNSRGLMRYSKGSLTSVHEAWNDKCEACHRPFAPIDGKRWSPAFLSFATGKDSDTSCKTCHQGPDHSPSQLSQDVKSCAGCHIDHRGRDVSLVRLGDQECTSCHANLRLHRAEDAKPSGIAEAIHSFAGDHPPFSTEAKGASDPGRLKFNHALHLNPGLVRNLGDRDAKTLAYIQDPLSRQRYRRKDQSDSALIELDCTSCHVTDAGDYKIDLLAGLPRSTTLPARGSGKEVLPIAYENQCKACHPLTFDGRNPELAAPHRAQPQAIRQFLWSTYAGVYVRNDDKMLAKVPQNHPIPGPLPHPDPDQDVKEKIERAVDAAEKVLYGGKTTCFECHDATKTTDDGRPEAIVAPNVPDVWLVNSRFDHTAHRGVGCRDCHNEAKTSAKSSDILIPGIASCRECHAPSQSSGFFAASKAPRGGVRHDCTACHHYHHGDSPLQGRGSLAGKGTDERDFAQFLKGTSHNR